MVGTVAEPIQIDEVRFAGKWKYNRKRFRQGNLAPESVDSEAEVENNRSDGRWVFRLEKGVDCRYFYVDRVDTNMLSPIIIQECAPGSVIHWDEWQAYFNWNSHGFVHCKVNHQRYYADLNSRGHREPVERSWLDAKIKILRKMRGTTNRLIQSHLDEFCCRVMRKDFQDWFTDFLNDISLVYR